MISLDGGLEAQIFRIFRIILGRVMHATAMLGFAAIDVVI